MGQINIKIYTLPTSLQVKQTVIGERYFVFKTYNTDIFTV